MKHLYISHVILGVLIGMSVHGIYCVHVLLSVLYIVRLLFFVRF